MCSLLAVWTDPAKFSPSSLRCRGSDVVSSVRVRTRGESRPSSCKSWPAEIAGTPERGIPADGLDRRWLGPLALHVPSFVSPLSPPKLQERQGAAYLPMVWIDDRLDRRWFGPLALHVPSFVGPLSPTKLQECLCAAYLTRQEQRRLRVSSTLASHALGR